MDIGVEYAHEKGRLYLIYEIGSKKEKVLPFIPKGSEGLKLSQIKKTLNYFKDKKIHGWHVFLNDTELTLENDDCKVRYNKLMTTKLQIPSIYHSGRTVIHVNLKNNGVDASSELGHPHISDRGDTCLGNTIKANFRFDALLPIKMIEWAETYVGSNPYTYLESVYCMDTKTFMPAKVRETTMYFLGKDHDFLDTFKDEGLFVQNKFAESTLIAYVPYLNLRFLEHPFEGDFEYLNEKLWKGIKEASLLFFRGTSSSLILNVSEVNEFSQLDKVKVVSGAIMIPDSVSYQMSSDLKTLRLKTSESVSIPGVTN